MRRVIATVLLLAACASPESSATRPAVARDVPPSEDRAAVVDVMSAADGSASDVAAPQPDASTMATVLRVRYPAGMGSVSLRGDAAGLLGWERAVTFRRVDGDTWEWSSDAVRAPFAWKPLLDDATWSIGPNYTATPGATVVVWPRFRTQNGAARRVWSTFRSEVLGNTRGVWVYLPPSYEEQPTRRYPVVYMHDGQNVFDPATSFGGVAWEADDAMNLGAGDGSIREAIVVGVENTAARIDEYTPTRDATQMRGGRAALYLRMLVDELKPRVDREYRTLPGRADTALVGSSLGGLVTAWIGVERADVFGLLGVMSPSTWWDGRSILGAVATTPARAQRPLRVWVDSGDAGPSRDGVDDTRALAQTYRDAGYRDGVDLRYVVAPGATHTESAWRARLPDALRFLLGPRAD